MDSLGLYRRYLRQSMRAQLQYRTSFVLQTVSYFLLTAIEFLGIWALFARFGSLRGWTLPEVALFYGTINVAFAIADALGRGFDVFSVQVKSGDFDRILLRPRTAVLQLFGFEVTLRRIGRVSQGLVVLGYGVALLGIYRHPVWLLLICYSLASSVVLFLALFVIQATVSFWTVESLEIMNTMTYGGVDAAQYPMSIYRRLFRGIFTFLVPLLCVCYLPLSTVIGRGEWAPWLAWTAPLSGFAFFGVALLFWRFGVRHYTSTGS